MPSWLTCIAVAFVLHAIGMVLLLLNAHAPTGKIDVADLISFRLVPPEEGTSPVYMLSSNPDAMPPPGNDGIPDPAVVQGDKLPMELANVTGEVSDAELSEILSSEREALREELDRMGEVADADPVKSKPVPLPTHKDNRGGNSGAGPEGAIRELDLDGYPQAVVDDIMERYKLRIITQTISGGRRGDSFLSSASKGQGEQFFGGMSVPAGVYEVFQLSRESVALMSRLEEEALRKKGLEPLQSRVIRIVFGIVKEGEGKFILGVKTLEAEAVGQ